MSDFLGRLLIVDLTNREVKVTDFPAMGWDAEGRPTPEKLWELGLEQ